MRPVTLVPPTLREVEQARLWRNRPEVRLGLRTPIMLTEAQQVRFWEDVVNDRRGPHRYWSLRAPNPLPKDPAMLDGVDSTFVGLGGLTDVQWENGSAEISLLINPALAGAGYGAGAVNMLLAEGFQQMRLFTIYGECYGNNSQALGFWRAQVERLHGEAVLLPRRKWWGGRLWASLYFCFASTRWQDDSFVALPPR